MVQTKGPEVNLLQTQFEQIVKSVDDDDRPLVRSRGESRRDLLGAVDIPPDSPGLVHVVQSLYQSQQFGPQRSEVVVDVDLLVAILPLQRLLLLHYLTPLSAGNKLHQDGSQPPPDLADPVESRDVLLLDVRSRLLEDTQCLLLHLLGCLLLRLPDAEDADRD